MKSFHGDPAIKQKYVRRVKRHQELDNITQGLYWENGKGCAVGCTLEMEHDPHDYYPIELGIPIWLAYLEDRMFEAMSAEQAKEFPLSFLEAIPVGVEDIEWDKLRARFLILCFESCDDCDEIVVNFMSRTIEVLQEVGDLTFAQALQTDDAEALIGECSALIKHVEFTPKTVGSLVLLVRSIILALYGRDSSVYIVLGMVMGYTKCDDILVYRDWLLNELRKLKVNKK